ncbi:DUF6708 domain-containing protein [Paraburkholderia largidicola]|uniref:DUF6708 domain-containing protein n=1 Tax=Paraburkholderia largidicola TaxID=3014751 RepID=A0A7I8BJH4_9BURK|nr:DUF6708 domain-containing protein [Paraburkholderia sp. PGU16]BCF88762.1 hypothetical protein PPGU16_18290 [Paraburkholderia sp. PGU16]
MADMQPLLNPPAQGWERDLPGPNDRPHATPGLFSNVPNHVDNIFVELSRAYLDFRGLLVWIAPLMFLAPFGMIWLAFLTFDDANPMPLGLLLLTAFVLMIGVWGGSVGVRMDISPPRDLPLRFNRARRKVYAYEFKAIWWNPFVRWPVWTVSYDWDDIRAEAWRQRGATANGGYIVKAGVVLSVVKPGTNEVIDRFQLGAKAGGEAAWAYVCTYMQQGPQALPPSKRKPRDWNNEPTMNLARLLAPKVKWPEAMDVESRTASSLDHVT